MCPPHRASTPLHSWKKYLIELSVGDQFKKVFIIFTCATMLVSNIEKNGTMIFGTWCDALKPKGPVDQSSTRRNTTLGNRVPKL